MRRAISGKFGLAQIGIALVLATGASKAAALVALGQDASAEADIVVSASPAVRTSIDREIYSVRESAETRAKNVLDILAQVPGLEVTPDGQLRLLGRSGVKVLVDGVEISNPQAYLQGTQANQIASVEVISNPSAAYSAQGTAGIINLVTRSSFQSAFGGSLSSKVGVPEFAEFRIAPNIEVGPFSASMTASLTKTNSTSISDRSRHDLEADASSAELKKGSGQTVSATWSANATYHLSETQSLSASSLLAMSEVDRTSIANIYDSLGNTSFEDSRSSGSVNSMSLNATYLRSLPKSETKITAKLSSISLDSQLTSAASSGSGLVDSFNNSSSSEIDSAGLDIENSIEFGTANDVKFGAGLQYSGERAKYNTVTTMDGSFSVQYLDGSWLEGHAFLTSKMQLRNYNLLLGLRVEGRRYDSNAIGPSVGERTYIFPSAHVERKVGRNWELNASYSRRVSWPTLSELSPNSRFSDARTAVKGNPHLKPELTDSLEIKSTYSRSPFSAQMSVYYRHVPDVRSTAVDLENDVLISQPANVGTKDAYGGNVSLRGRLGRRINYSLAGNLYHQKVSFAARGGSHARTFQYDASATVTYREHDDEERHSDIVEARFRYNGPVSDGLLKVDSYATLNLNWMHIFSKRLTASLALDNPFGVPRIKTSLASEVAVSVQADQATERRMLVGLTYRMGKLDD